MVPRVVPAIVVPIVAGDVRMQPLNFLRHAGSVQAADEVPGPDDAEEQELPESQHDDEHEEIDQACLEVKQEFMEIKQEFRAQQTRPGPVRLPPPAQKRFRRTTTHAYLKHGNPKTSEEKSDQNKSQHT